MGHIADALLRGLGADAVGHPEGGTVCGGEGAEVCCGGTGGYLQRAADLAAVADHAGDGAGHIPDRMADPGIIRSHQIGHGGTGSGGGGHDAAAHGGQLANVGVYVPVH